MSLRSDLSNVKVLYIKPDDMSGLENISNANDISSIKRKSYDALIESVALKIGTDLRGLLSRKDKKLFDKAITKGYKSPDIIQMMAHGLSNFGTAITNINIEKLLPITQQVPTPSLISSIRTNFQRNTEKTFFLLIDDIDQVASLMQEDQTNRVWGALLSIKKLCEEFSNIKCIVTLRTEVWLILCRDPKGQRDQVDHFRPLIRYLDPNDDHISEILKRRLTLVKNIIDPNDGSDPINFFFENINVTLPTTQDERRLWIDFLVKSSRSRPRDGIQFLSIIARKSRESGHTKITEDIVDVATIQYSKERSEDLSREFSLECLNVDEIIHSFSKIQFKLTTEELRDHLLTIPSICNISIRGKTIHPENEEDDLFCLWSFIHEIGLINPCIPDSRQPREFRHLRYDEDSLFIRKSNWNEMQKVYWEIHPAYRFYLIKLREDNNARSGVSISKLFRKKDK
jgi:hypothetical protein